MKLRIALRSLTGAVVAAASFGIIGLAVTPGIASAATGGTVQGHVVDQLSVPLNDICLQLVKPGKTNSPNNVLVSLAPSDTSGFFTQANVPAGKYVGYYTQCGPITTGSTNSEPVAVYTGNTLDKGAATKISVKDGTTVDLGTLQLAAGGDTSGTLLDARSSAGAVSVSVLAFTPATGLLVNQTCTDSNGHFTLFNLPATGVKLEFAPTKVGTCGNDSAYQTRWFGGSSYATASTVPITPGSGGTIATTTLADSTGAQVISSITFTHLGSGKAFAPTITINGTNFGKTAPAPDPATETACGSPSSGFDYGTKLYFNDWTAGWQAGHIGDCIGFVINSWSKTQIVLTLGDFYFDPQYAGLQSGDQYTMVVKKGTFTGTAN